jgi:hypothetical protein
MPACLPACRSLPNSRVPRATVCNGPNRDYCRGNRYSFCYLFVNPLKRTLSVWYMPWISLLG